MTRSKKPTNTNTTTEQLDVDSGHYLIQRVLKSSVAEWSEWWAAQIAGGCHALFATLTTLAGGR